MHFDFEAAAPTVVLVLVVWVFGLVLLFWVAARLSERTLRVTDVARDPARLASPALRRIYRAVLHVTCLYYWLSIPILLMSILAGAAGALYVMFALGIVVPKVLVLVLVIFFGTLGAFVEGMRFRRREAPPGPMLDLASHPELAAALDEVRRRVGAPPLDAIYLQTGTIVGVMERGSLVQQLRGRSEHALVLGVGMLEGLTRRQLKSILAHELGHLRNRDTAGGSFALAVRRSLVLAAGELQRSGATKYNPAWWFVQLFSDAFLRVSQGASRLQEILADRWAVEAYGSETFAGSLRRTLEHAALFEARWKHSLEEALEGEVPVDNLYRFARGAPIEDDAVAAAVAAQMGATPSQFDSHPAPADRIEAALALAEPGAPADEDDERKAWSYFASRKDIELQMTEVARAALAKAGLRLAREPAAEE